MKRAIEQFNGREGETATFLSRCLLFLNLCGSGFAPRHLSRWAFFVKIKHLTFDDLNTNL